MTGSHRTHGVGERSFPEHVRSPRTGPRGVSGGTFRPLTAVTTRASPWPSLPPVRALGLWLPAVRRLKLGSRGRREVHTCHPRQGLTAEPMGAIKEGAPRGDKRLFLLHLPTIFGSDEGTRGRMGTGDGVLPAPGPPAAPSVPQAEDRACARASLATCPGTSQEANPSGEHGVSPPPGQTRRPLRSGRC